MSQEIFSKVIKICVLDYGAGNVRSVMNMLSRLNKVEVVLSNSLADIISATHLILPGVGSFPAAMRKITSELPLNKIESQIFNSKIPFLGICVGMQVLAEEGYEHTHTKGLGWISGSVMQFESNELSLPHVGWNSVKKINNDPFLNNIDDSDDFYFVHSFVFKPKNELNALAVTEYGNKFTAIVKNKNIYGVQFHPEKSQLSGLKLIKNFLEN